MLLHAKSPQDTHPSNCKIRLKPHQLAMLKKCKDIESLNYKYGILADKPGAGKTYVLLSMILCDEVKGLNIIVVPQNILVLFVEVCRNYVGKFEIIVTYNRLSQFYF